jgi:hypothetical protein
MTAPGWIAPQGRTLAYDCGTPLVPSFILLWIGLVSSLIMADESPTSRRPPQSFRIFADLKHTGILTGPLTSSPAPNEFGITVPLPAVSASRDRWPEKLDAADQIVERLGRLRVEQVAIWLRRRGVVMVAPGIPRKRARWNDYPKAARDLLRALLAKGLAEEAVFAATEDEMTLGAG